MRLNEVHFEAGPPVEGYGPGFFRISGDIHRGAVAVLPSGPLLWQAEDPTPFLALAGQIDVVFLGLGAEIAAPPDIFVEALEAAGIGVEVMATPPACRTYNVLLGEGRRIAAALLPV